MSMKIEHLVASVDKKCEELCDDLHLKAYAIIANQTRSGSQGIKRDKKGNIIVNTSLIGVGINRNLGLIFSSKDYCILTDDDMNYRDDYLKIIKKAFQEIPEADVIIFNINTSGSKDRRRKNNKIKRVRYHNFMNYGAARIVFKRESILKHNIWFTTMFGGGSKYSSGEDTVFIKDCLDSKLKVFTYPKVIATVDQSSSTWFNGYSEKYYYDKGALLKVLFSRMYPFFALYLSIRLKSKIGFCRRYRNMIRGAREYEKDN